MNGGDSRLDLILLWHMHQPRYGTPGGEQRLPWCYLHAVKDYTDMAWHLERHPEARAAVNVTPVLLDQILAYERDFTRRTFSDPLLRALAAERLDTLPNRHEVIHTCLQANRRRMVDRFPPYRTLVGLAESTPDTAYLSDAYVTDLLVWYHLAWLGESLRSDERVRALQHKGRAFTHEDRLALVAVLHDAIAGIIPRYRALADAGRIELAVSPYEHPILPLLIDLTVAREARADLPLPQATRYPGGARRARRHLEEAAARYRELFGTDPAGSWPSEGAVSAAAVRMIGDTGFRWAASCETVLARSVAPQPLARIPDLYRPYRLDETATVLFFRDVRLSDRIGFEYASWHADDAVANLVHELEAIALAASEIRPCVTIALDGENPWEHYPENGRFFLEGLYRTLSAHPFIRLTTPSTVLATDPPVATLPRLVAGSWVYGDLSTWIGDPIKNRAWELLVAAKEAFDGVAAVDPQRAKDAEPLLRTCEGSDWFWWPAAGRGGGSSALFDALFREHLRALYEALGYAVPADVEQPLHSSGGADAAAMIANQPISSGT